jgi:hypothetical protein
MARKPTMTMDYTTKPGSFRGMMMHMGVHRYFSQQAQLVG